MGSRDVLICMIVNCTTPGKERSLTVSELPICVLPILEEESSLKKSTFVLSHSCSYLSSLSGLHFFLCCHHRQNLLYLFYVHHHYHCLQCCKSGQVSPEMTIQEV